MILLWHNFLIQTLRLIWIESNHVEDAPIIDPADSVTIDVNQGITIDCKAKNPITWVFEVPIKSTSF